MDLDTREKRIHNLVLRDPVFVIHTFDVSAHRDPKIRMAKELSSELGFPRFPFLIEI